MSEELLDSLLSQAVSVLNTPKPRVNTLKETNIFALESNSELSKSGVEETNRSVLHGGETDSSEDEDNKYYEEQKYSTYGREIKQLLLSASKDHSENPTSTASWGNKVNSNCSNFNQSSEIPTSTATWTSKVNSNGSNFNQKPAVSKPQNVYTDPVFGIRIINPIVPLTTLRDRMVGREAVPFTLVKKFVSGNISDKNWVIGGVIVRKSAVKTSQKGNQFTIWTLSDLKADIKTVSLFLFGNAYEHLWKTPLGTVIGVLNMSVLDRKEASKDEATLSVDNAQKVMILGQSKDYGTCKSKKKNGEPCDAVVNLSKCDYCVYHIKQEYQKWSRRSDFQANFTGKQLPGSKRNMAMKSEISSHFAAKVSVKLQQHDQSLLQTLTKNIRVDDSHTDNNLDIHLKKKSNAKHNDKLNLPSFLSSNKWNESKNMTVKLDSKIQNIAATGLKHDLPLNEQNKFGAYIPKLAATKSGIVDLNEPSPKSKIGVAKKNAIKYIQKNGPIAKANPNDPGFSAKKRKHCLEKLTTDGGASKKQKTRENGFLSDRFKKIMEATSTHTDILDDRDDEEKEKYFNKLEVKEKMEEKMINTYRVPCKAVRCLHCKYTSFSAAELCKKDKHPLKVFDAVKRFFKCNNCNSHTQTLDVIPTSSCQNCGLSKWVRCGMLKEKLSLPAPTLSIRGGEQTFINSSIVDNNLDLLVPDV